MQQKLSALRSREVDDDNVDNRWGTSGVVRAPVNYATQETLVSGAPKRTEKLNYFLWERGLWDWKFWECLRKDELGLSRSRGYRRVICATVLLRPNSENSICEVQNTNKNPIELQTDLFYFIYLPLASHSL